MIDNAGLGSYPNFTFGDKNYFYLYVCMFYVQHIDTYIS